MSVQISLICFVAYTLLANCFIRLICFFKRQNERLKKKFTYPLDIVAHRGGSLIGPENTLYAFEKALNNGGANVLEMDVWLSLDKKIVVSHDDELGRTCGERYRNVKISQLVVGDFPNNTLPQCARSIALHFKNGNIMDYKASDDVPIDELTRVCLLTEVFERFPGVPMHVDIKALGAEAVYIVLDMIRKFRRESYTIVGSSVTENKMYIKDYFTKNTAIRPKFRIFANTSDFMYVYLFYYLGLLPFCKLDFDVFSIPVYTTSMREEAQTEHGYVASLMASFFFTSPSLWRYLQYRGIAVLGWVVNGESNLAEAALWPLNGIITDDPVCLFNSMKSKKM
ncbi:unnamed protein product [Phytomonas sp. EM1]|nr:unnamed protein product [Phytomonas sp. EM1]|eukprot:CCW62287.1 unnamed protein product [Phytomonas sp. isolate EM1]